MCSRRIVECEMPHEMMFRRLLRLIAEEVLAEGGAGKGAGALRPARARALAQEALEGLAHLRGGDAGPGVHLAGGGGRLRERRGLVPPALALAPLVGGERAQVGVVARALVVAHPDDAHADHVPVSRL